MKFISMTNSTNSVNVKAWDSINKCMYDTTATFKGELNDKAISTIRKEIASTGNMLLKVYTDSVVTSDCTKYRMEESKFFELAKPVSKRPNGDYISRTATAYCYNVVLFDNYTESLDLVTKYTSEKDSKKAFNAFKREFRNTDKQVLDIELLNEVTQLYIMPVSEFITYAEKVDA